jgi:hypothetical protein
MPIPVEFQKCLIGVTETWIDNNMRRTKLSTEDLSKWQAYQLPGSIEKETRREANNRSRLLSSCICLRRVFCPSVHGQWDNGRNILPVRPVQNSALLLG